MALTACGNDIPSYLDQPEEELGLRESWYGSDHRLFHAALLHPYAVGLRTSGYVVGVEKGEQDKVEGPKVEPGLLVAASDTDSDRFKAIRARLEGDEKSHLVTHVIRYEASADTDGRARVTQCVVYTALDRSENSPHHDDPAGRLFNPCPALPGYAPPPQQRPGAFPASWTAIDELRERLIRDLRDPRHGYTDILVVVMGWNTAQEEAVGNVNGIVGQLLDEAQAQGRDFRPLVVGVTWPSVWALPDWSVVPAALVRGLSFFNKADDAEEVGVTWLREVIAHAVLPARKAARVVMQQRAAGPGARVVLIGHSFGARALVAAITQRPQLQAPTGSPEGFLERRDPALLLEGAFEIDRLFDWDRRTTARPRMLEAPFSAGDPTLVLTASAFDKAVSAALWGWYAGDIRTYDEACGHALDGTPWRGLSFDAFGCGLARKVEEPAYGFDLCTPNQRVGVGVAMDGKRVRYMDATHVVNCTPPAGAGGSHSDIYRRETARFLLDELR